MNADETRIKRCISSQFQALSFFYEIFKSAAPQASRMIGLPSRQRLLEHVVFRTIASSHQKKEKKHDNFRKTNS